MEGPAEQKPSSIFENPRMRDFIKDRHIKPEDYPLLQELAAFDKNEFIECLHNIFNTYRERSNRELEREIELARTEQKKKIYEKALQFLRRYDWAVAYNMVRVIEDL